MELIIITVLVASNLWLISRFLKKADNPDPEKKTGTPTTPPAEVQTKTALPEPASESIIGESTIDMNEVRELIKASVLKQVKDEIVRVVQELTKPEDVGLPPEDEEPAEQSKPPIPTIPQEKLDEVFTNRSVSETLGEELPPHEPVTEGHDFNSLETAVRVAKDEPHTPEEAAIAKDAMSAIKGTAIDERLSLDPKVRTKILTIYYGDEDEPLNEETIANKKVVFSGTIDTFDVDKLNLNILT